VRLLRKVAADLWAARGRAALVILAMTTGLIAVVCVASTNAILGRELRRSFAAITPASAVLRTARFDAALLDDVRRVPGVALADGGRSLLARAGAAGDPRTVLLFAPASFGSQRVNRLRPQTGAWPPAPNTVLLERAAVRVAALGVGAPLAVRVDARPPVSLAVAGTVHDFSQAPAWQEGVVYGYVDTATMARLTGTHGLTEIRLVADRPADVRRIRDVAARVASLLAERGVRVRDVEIPTPGAHPHQGQMDALLGMQQAFGAFALLLAGALVVVLLDAMLAQHRPQIGAMKAIGGSRRAIGGMYVLWIVALAGAAEALALPAGLAAGRAYARFIAEMLNFDVADDRVPWPVLLALVAAGAALPLLVAVAPILRAVAVTTREALSDAPVARLRAGRSAGDSRARLIALGVANAVRVRGRFALVASTVALGAALCLAALDVGRSFQGTLAVTVASLGYDVAFATGDGIAPDSVAALVRALPDVASVETAVRVRSVLADARAADLTAFGVRSGPSGTPPPALELQTGRWLGSDGRDVVANHVWARDHPEYAVGDSVSLRVGGDSTRWRLVGVARELMSGPTLYAPAAALDAAARGAARTTIVHVVSTRHDPATVRPLMAAIDRALDARGVVASGLASLRDTQRHREDHVLVITRFLVALAGACLVVGGLGLATVLGVGVVERSREIGVMRALGASRAQLFAIVLAEGGWIALVGWLGGVALSVPAAALVGRVFGRTMLGTPLDLYLSAGAVPALAAVTAAVALVASAAPAWRAATTPPRALLTA
jgi:putative ABC transport system permease protein